MENKFPDHLIVRLPGLFGHGLKKNVIYDLIHRNQVENIHPESAFQYYDLKHLTADIEKARAAGLRLVHLTSEQIKTQSIVDRFFPQVQLTPKSTAPVAYDFRTQHAALWNQEVPYQYSGDAVFKDLGQFLEANGVCA